MPLSPWLKLALLSPAVYAAGLWYPQSEGGHIVFQFAVLMALVLSSFHRQSCPSCGESGVSRHVDSPTGQKVRYPTTGSGSRGPEALYRGVWCGRSGDQQGLITPASRVRLAGPLPNECAVTLTGKRTGCGPVDRVRLPAAPTILLALWAFAIILSTALSSDPVSTLLSSHMRGEGALQHLCYVALLWLLLRSKIDLRWLVWGGVAVCLWGLLPAVGWTEGGVLGLPRFRGNLGNPLYLATGLTFALWAALKLRWWHAAIPFAAAMLATQSKGAILGLAVALIFYLFHTRQQEIAFVLTVLLTVGMFMVPKPTSGTIREGIWDAAVHGIVQRPWGWGAENFPLAWDANFVPITTIREYHGPPEPRTDIIPHWWHDRAHNVLLDRAIEWGWIGVVVWVFLLVGAWKRGRALDQSAILLYLLQGMFMFDCQMSMIGAVTLIAYCWRRDG